MSGDRVATPARSARLWLLPGAQTPLPEVGRRYPRLAIAVNLFLIAAAVPVFVFVVPPSTWQPQTLFTLLVVLGMLAVASPKQMRPQAFCDSAYGPAFVAVLLLGPLPGLAVLLASECVCALQRYTKQNVWITSTTNVAVQCWACLTLSLALMLGGFVAGDPVNSLELVVLGVAAGVAGCLSNNLVLSLSFKTWDGTPFRHAALVDGVQALFVDSAMVVGVLTVTILYQQIGLVALIPLIGIIFLPQVLLWRIVGDRPISELSEQDATGAYARMLADLLKLNAEEKAVIASVAPQSGNGGIALKELNNFERVMQARLYVRERWDGADKGFPGALSGEQIPIESRVLAVAEEWSAFTAKGTRELEPEVALIELRAKAGAEFDPRVIAAAAKAVEQTVIPVEARKPVRLRATPTASLKY